MTTPTDLEDRLRAGLRSAAEVLPAPTTLRLVEAAPARRRRVRPALATAAALAVVAGVTAVVAGLDDGPAPTGKDDVSVGPATSPPAAAELRVTNGMTPGRAVVNGSELRTYGPDGAPTGTVDLAPLRDVQGAASDLAGGWVVCGREEATMDARVGWFPADGDSVIFDLDQSFVPFCSADGLQVVDSADGPMALLANDMGPPAWMQPEDPPPYLRAVVLATGEFRDVPVPRVVDDGSISSSATTDRVLVHSALGLQLFDLASGDELDAPDVDLGQDPTELALAPDGTSAAALVGPPEGPRELVIIDMTTGAETFRRSFPLRVEGDEMSYDGTTVAVGSFYEGPVTVIDLASGDERTLDTHGSLV